MANIKNLRMWDDIRNDSRVSVRKTMLGLKTTAIYQKTQSIIEAKTIEYTPQDGDRLRSILEAPVEKMEETIGDFHPSQVPNGNYLTELCSSQDGEFVALMLFQFQRMSYEPVTPVIIFEGKEAQVVRKIFF